MYNRSDCCVCSESFASASNRGWISPRRLAVKWLIGMKSSDNSQAVRMQFTFRGKLFSVYVNYGMEAVIQIHQAYVMLWLPGVRIHLHCSNPTNTQHLDNYLRWKHINLSIYALTSDWMLYPWLPSHVICIIFITKPYSVFFFFSPSFLLTQYTESQFHMWTDENPKRGKYRRGFSSTAWRANELHVRRCTSRGSYFHLLCLAVLRDKCRPALVRVPQRLFSKLCNFCWTHCEPIVSLLVKRNK